MANCLVCGSDKINLLTTIHNAPAEAQCFLKTVSSTNLDCTTLNIFFCPNCGHVQSGGNLVSYYKDVITASGFSSVVMNARLDKILNSINQYSVVDKPHLLDIGSGNYSFIDFIKPLGLFSSITGLENSLLQKQNDIEHSTYYVQGYIDKDSSLHCPKLPSSQFEFISCFNFLEHIPDPYLFLQKLKTYLSTSALLYFTVPSFDFIRRTDCVHEFIADHLSYFSNSSLSLLFGRAGYSVLYCNSINNDNDLEILATYNPPVFPDLNSGFQGFIGQANILLQSLKNDGESIAFWGAGHRNLTLISQLKYNNIDFIVDSASFKQGLYSPVSNIPIISPEKFQGSPTSCLFISLPGLYNQEVLSNVMSWNVVPKHIFFVNENSINPINE